MPSKPGRYGLKIYWVYDAETLYALTGEIYVGQQIEQQRGNLKDLVERLGQPWLNNKGRNIFTDNYFGQQQ